MKSSQALDRAILEVVEQHQPTTMAKIVDEVAKHVHMRGMKSNRTITEHVYQLKKDGKLAMIGTRQEARYTLPGYSPIEKQSEQGRQIVEGRRREAPVVADLYLKPAPAVMVMELPDLEDDLPAGWHTLRQQIEEPEPAQIEPSPPPPQSIVHEQPFKIEISGLAADLAAQVALTTERTLGPGIKRLEATIADLRRQIAEKNDEIAKLREEQRAAEQLASEAEEKYNTLRQKILSL